MKPLLLFGMACGLCLQHLNAQVVPTTPTQFGKRGVGTSSNSDNSAIIGLSPQSAKTQTLVKEISYLTLSEARQWTNTDGKSVIGKLIAYEQTVQTLPAGQSPSPSTAPVLPSRPTLIRQGNIRLLVQQKAFELPLARLSQADRDFVQALDAAIAKKAASPSPSPSKTP